jgi:hypothetical protein
MSNPRSRQLFKSIAVGFLECREADSVKFKNLSSIHFRKGPAGTEEKTSD